jgi:hypothetical protein
MDRKFISLLHSCLLPALLALPIYAQFSLNPFTIETSPLMSELRAIKSTNPKMTADEFVEAANKALERTGVVFSFYLNHEMCEKIEKAFASRKPGEPAPVLKAALNSVGGDKASLILPPPDRSSCAVCSVSLPVLQTTNADFVTIINGLNVKFYMPKEFLMDEVVLLDPADLTKATHSFRVPFRTKPLGVLYDENGVYMEMPDPSFSEITLLVFDEGTFQFATRKEAESNGKSAAFDPGKNGNADFSYLQFQLRGRKEIVRFRKPCN